MTFRAVLFDLDGTLLNTLQDLADSVNAALAAFGLPPRTNDEYKSFVGEGRRPLAIRSLPLDRRDEASIDLMSTLIGEEYSKRLYDTTRPYDGVPEMLEALATHGLRMAVLTNKPQQAAFETVKRFLPGHTFEVILGESDSVPRKPDPTGALRVASQMELEPADYAYLGDSAIDMYTANRARMYAVGALWGFRTREELVSAGARTVIEHPAEFVRLFDGSQDAASTTKGVARQTGQP